MLGKPIGADHSPLVVGGHRGVVIGTRGRGPVRVRRDRSLVILPGNCPPGMGISGAFIQVRSPGVAWPRKRDPTGLAGASDPLGGVA